MAADDDGQVDRHAAGSSRRSIRPGTGADAGRLSVLARRQARERECRDGLAGGGKSSEAETADRSAGSGRMEAPLSPAAILKGHLRRLRRNGSGGRSDRERPQAPRVPLMGMRSATERSEALSTEKRQRTAVGSAEVRNEPEMNPLRGGAEGR